MNNSPPTVLNNEYICRVNTVRHLGLYLTSTLDWNTQIYHVCLKANRKLSVLRRVKNLQRNTLDLLYKITVRSVIDYSIFVYYQTLTLLQKNKLDKIQYSAAKLVSSTLHYTSREKLEKELGWESIRERADNLGLTLFHKIHCNVTRPLVKSCMPVIRNTNTALRSNTVYMETAYKGLKYRNSFFPYMSRRWNKLPKDIKQKTVDDFKEYLKLNVKPKRYKFYGRGFKFKCSLLTRIRVGRSFLNEHSFSINLSESPSCQKCLSPRESPLHYITSCPEHAEHRAELYTKMEQFIPQFKLLPKKRQFEILIYGYESDNDEMVRINTKIMILTQNFIYDTKRFI